MSTFISDQRPSSRTDLRAWYGAVLQQQEKAGLSVAEAAGMSAMTPETPAFVEVVAEPAAIRSSAATSTFLVRLPSGIEVAVPADFDGAALERLISSLKRSRC